MSFDVPPGVAVYGGFAGGETQRSERDPRANVTILSGDVDGDDTNTDGNFIDESTGDLQGVNSYHVVTMDGTQGTPMTTTTVLDGFTVTGGNATDASLDAIGGGLLCDGLGPGSRCNPNLVNVTFSGNHSYVGGAMANADGSPTLTNVILWGDSADSSDPEIRDVSSGPSTII